MRRLACCILAVAVAGCARAPSVRSPQVVSQAAGAVASLPPLVERDVFFGDPEIAYAALSPDGRFISFVKQLDGVLNVWVKGMNEPFSAARPITHDTKRPVIGYFWSEDGRNILFVQDKAGDENFRVYGVDPAAAPAPGSKVPPARDLTPYANVRAQIYAVPKKTPDFILVGLNDRDPKLHDVYRVDLRNGQRQLVFRNEQNIAGWVADLDGNLRLAVRVKPDGGTEILRVDGNTLTQVYDCTYEESCDAIRFHRDGRRVYLATNKGDVDRTRLALFDPRTGAIEPVESDPESRVDFAQAIFSNATDELIATQYVGDRVRVYPRDPQFARDVERIRQALPNMDLFFRVPTRDDRIWIVKGIEDTNEGANYIYDRTTGKVELLYRPRTDIPAQHMTAMRPVRYTARDGVEIPAYLSVPKGVEAKSLPAVIFPHGGPWGRDQWGFNPIAQFLANRGYVVLMPNFRGSTGYGKRFLNLGNKEWGTGTMQHDLTDGARWLIDQGIADPKRIGIMGISYGGYATLAGVAFTPEIYAAGVSFVGPSSIITLLNSIPPYWEPIRKVFSVRVGDVASAEDMPRLRAQSPLYSASRITAPLLVIQGANDPRVKKAESDQIVIALRDLGRTVEYLVAPDEGHGFAGEVNNLATYAEIERFLARHLGGRYQESMSPTVRDRLALLRVKIDTLTGRAAAEVTP
jgi:dipeptidyl aminopeptidase/acylaminoacyl peptidase